MNLTFCDLGDLETGGHDCKIVRHPKGPMEKLYQVSVELFEVSHRNGI